MLRVQPKNRPRFSKPRVVFRGRFIVVEQWNATYPDGRTELYERVRRVPSVAVLAFDRRGRLLLIQEYRHVHRQWRWGVPAGRVDKETSVRAAAQRELQEEAGCRARRLRLFLAGTVGGSWAIPRYLYLANSLVRDPLPQDHGEEIRVVPTPFRRAYRMALDGTILNEFVALGIIRLWHQRQRFLGRR